MASRSVSEPVRLLADYLSSTLRRQITPRQIERWRQHGLIPAASWSGGDGTGSTTTYSPPYAQGLAAAQAVKAYRTLDNAVIALWGDGWNIRASHLRRAVLRWLEGQQDAYRREFDSNPEHAASATAFRVSRRPIGRLWMSRLAAEEGDPYRSMMDAFEEAFRLGFGSARLAESPSPTGLVALGDAPGMLAQAATLISEPVPADILEAPMPTAWPASLGAAARGASAEQWELARTMGSVLSGVIGPRPDISTGFDRGLFGLGFMVMMHNQPVVGEAAPFIIDWLMNM